MDNSELISEVVANATENQSAVADGSKPVKKKFVAPEISVPVDVLEATTFFQAVASGQTN